MIFYKYINRFITIFTIVGIIILFQSPVKARIFFDFVENFITEGKVITVRIEEGIENRENLVLIPESDCQLIRVKDNRSIVLESNRSYNINVEKKKGYYFQVQVFATTDKVKSDKIWWQLVNNGYQEVKVIHEKDLYKVRVGHFPEKEGCQYTKTQLEKDGFNTWIVKAEEVTSPHIYVYDQDMNQIFSGKRIKLAGNVKINKNLYQGQISFSLKNQAGEQILNLINTTGFDVVICGLMENRFKQEENKLDSNVLKTYAVVLRTNLFYRLFNDNQQVLSLPEFKGVDCRPEIKEAVSATSGLILTNKSDPADIKIKLEGYELLSYLNYNFRDILLRKYRGLNITNLKQYKKEKVRVDAEIEWGLDYKEIYQLNWNGPRLITILDLNLAREGFIVKPVLAKGRVSGLDDLGQMVKEQQALAAINGGYFNYRRPLGLILINGVPVSEPLKNRTAMILREDSQVFFRQVNWQGVLSSTQINNNVSLDGINRIPQNNEIIYFNKYYGDNPPDLKEGMLELTIENGKIIAINNQEQIIPVNGFVIQAHGRGCDGLEDLQIGDSISIDFNFKPDLMELKTKHAIGGGPRLLKDGKLYINSREEEFQPDIASGRAPRSAVGVTEDNHLIFITVDGRQPELSIGITLRELALYMQKYGIVDGVNLDGGNSARMVVRGFIMNNPSGERLVSNGILIKK